jgi:hypothetical protein
VITAPEGNVLAAIDFKNQELYFIAVLSGDEEMLKAFESPSKLPLKDENGNLVYDESGEQIYYKNPESDLHLITAMTCCFPEIFKGVMEHELDKVARNPKKLPKLLGSPRGYGKTTNFGIVYRQTAQSMAELNYLPLEETEKWLSNHKKQFQKAHQWLEQETLLAEVRGWAPNALGRIRWTREDNAKKQGSSAGRSGVNHKIQSLGAELAKMSIIRLEKKFRGTPAKLIGLIHDECLIEVPGKAIFNPKQQEGYLEPEYKPDEEALSWVGMAEQELKKAEEELFNEIVSPKDYNRFEGLVESDISLFWAH